jgi:hypothetical protein
MRDWTISATSRFVQVIMAGKRRGPGSFLGTSLTGGRAQSSLFEPKDGQPELKAASRFMIDLGNVRVR